MQLDARRHEGPDMEEAALFAGDLAQVFEGVTDLRKQLKEQRPDTKMGQQRLEEHGERMAAQLPQSSNVVGQDAAQSLNTMD